MHLKLPTFMHKRSAQVRLWTCFCCLIAVPSVEVQAEPAKAEAAQAAKADEPVLGNIYIREYRLRGGKILTAREFEKAVYPFMGPRRGEQDVEQARQALEKAYKDRGYQTVYIEVPQQDARGGVIYLKAVEAPVGRLRVKGAKWYLPSDILKKAPSMQEGVVPDFNQVQKDLVALNQSPDRKVTPELRPGVVPGTVDIDLIVEDKSPFHGSIELNNRYNANTTPFRFNANVSYGNLWQLGHTFGLSYQVAPERADDARVFSGYYMLPVPGQDGLSLMLTGTKQDSNVSTLGGGAVAGRGEVLGFRLLKQLPSEDGFFHSLSFGMDYKNFEQDLIAAGTVNSSPVTYFPMTLSYSAGQVRKNSYTDLNLTTTFHLRGLGSNDTAEGLGIRRYQADDGFFHLRGDISHTHDLPGGFKAFAKIQSQLSGSSLINTEQVSIGGLSSVRGYLEATQLGDSGIIGTAELRSPTLLGAEAKDSPDEWRFYAFYDQGRVFVNKTLPAQANYFDLASVGIGTSIRWHEHLHGSVDLAVPLIDQPNAIANEFNARFRLWFDF
jgi:hemolysin activation/secretion protein